MGEQEAAHHETGLSLELANLKNLNKRAIEEIVNAAADKVMDGEIDSIDSLILAKKGVELFTQFEKKVRPIAEGHSKIGQNETYKKFDCELTSSMQGVKYDFSGCGDKIYQAAKEVADKATEALKERETFLRAVVKKMVWVDEETGETWEIQPPVKSGKLGIMVKIK